MIELSKCPNCASEDKVTIAGKDFCMRCGTPSQDTPQAGDTTSSAQPADSGAIPPPADQNPTSVSKFTDPATATVPQPVGDPTTSPATNMTPVENVVPEADSSSTLPPQPVAQPPQAPAPVMPDMQPPVSTISSAPAPDPTQFKVPATDSPIVAENSQMAQAQSPILTQAAPSPDPSNIPAPVVQPVTSAMPVNPPPESAPMPAPIQRPDVTTTPDPVQMPSDQPLTQPAAVPEPAPAPEVASEPRIHTHQAVMSLDKNDSGVFSDEQLDELSKISDQSEPLGMPANQPKADIANHGSTAPATFHTDIQPPGESKSPSTPTPATQSAVSKVADSDIKVPDKNSKGKKVLKPAGIALSIVALFLVGAYIWQVNYPTLAFKIASSKAGMSASMPGYMPGGYKLAGEIQTNPGSVSYNLVNGGQNKKISISQTKTDWDSQALAENYVAPKAENYLALQAQGLTIYMLGDSQATWVNKGTWYKIESPDQSLSQDQAIKIATSL